MNNSIFIAAFQEGYRFCTVDDEITFTQYELGDLIITSGKLIAADALVRMTADPSFDINLKPGYYPVTLSIASFLRRNDKRVAYAMFSIEQQIPVRWKMATYRGENSDLLGEDEYFGYGVDSGKGCFMDAEVEEVLYYSDFEEWQETLCYKLINLLDQNKTMPGGWANMSVDIDENKQGNIIAFSSGWGDGVYPSYFGYDEQGEIVKIVTDFLLFTEELSFLS